jgi:hypothetical protein
VKNALKSKTGVESWVGELRAKVKGYVCGGNSLRQFSALNMVVFRQHDPHFSMEGKQGSHI